MLSQIFNAARNSHHFRHYSFFGGVLSRIVVVSLIKQLPWFHADFIVWKIEQNDNMKQGSTQIIRQSMGSNETLFPQRFITIDAD